MFRGKVYKEGRLWMIEVPDLDLMTQGHTKEEAYEMLNDLLKTAIDQNNLKLDIARYRNDTFLLRGGDEQSEADLIALLLKRQRAKSGLSQSDMAKLLKAKSDNAYARYEQGKSVPGPLTMMKIFRAMGLDLEMRLRSPRAKREITTS